MVKRKHSSITATPESQASPDKRLTRSSSARELPGLRSGKKTARDTSLAAKSISPRKPPQKSATKETSSLKENDGGDSDDPLDLLSPRKRVKREDDDRTVIASSSRTTRSNASTKTAVDPVTPTKKTRRPLPVKFKTLEVVISTPSRKRKAPVAESDAEDESASESDVSPVLSPTKSSRLNKESNTPRQPVFVGKKSIDTSSGALKRKMSVVSPDSESEISPPLSPTKSLRLDIDPMTPQKSVSPSKRPTADASPTRKPLRCIPTHLQEYHMAQKHAILASLFKPPSLPCNDDEEDLEPNELATEQLSNLLTGTVERGEGNSCLIVGPRSSGKSRIIDKCLNNLRKQAIIIRLSGSVHTTDRLAMREIAYQLAQQTGKSFICEDEQEGMNDDDNPFLDSLDDQQPIVLPPPAHLPSLISAIPTLALPTIVVLEGFDLFALHPRQSLLYCLLDTSQSCRVGNAMKGLCVIGETTRLDCVTLLEKRVKSRFSGRLFRTGNPRNLARWTQMVKSILCAPIDVEEPDREEWRDMWEADVDRFMTERSVEECFSETYAITRDVAMLSKILIPPVLAITSATPSLSSAELLASIQSQRARPRLHFLSSISYPAMCMLIATIHWQNKGHDIVTFEMLHSSFSDQQKVSTSAPVQVDGGSIGMVKCRREVLLGAFEHLVSTKVYVHAAPANMTIQREFVKYRCTVERDDVKKLVERSGKTDLKKWLGKATAV